MASSFGATNVVVAVRARPLTPQELEDGNEATILSMDHKAKSTTLTDPATKQKKKFTFDYNYWSLGDPSSPDFASQKRIFHELGEAQLRHVFAGYNACIFAYGQTSSGKTYTMMGPPRTTSCSTVGPHTGLIPRMCKSMFDRITAETNDTTRYAVELSYYEIYNEKVYCLLDPTTNDALRLREDPKTGPYVENLTAVPVTHYLHVAELLRLGNRTRHTSKTRMNTRSSRSHAVCAITICRTEWNQETGDTTVLQSMVNLVDLAGSERTLKAGTEGDTLKEGININKSLTHLGMVIKRLADLGDPSVVLEYTHVPYRDSTLTFLLKDNLGGNSRTVMLATVSPCASNFEETYTTLRYAEQVKLIKNVPCVNQRSTTKKIIRELRGKIKALQLQVVSSHTGDPTVTFARDRLLAVWATTPFLKRVVRHREPFVWFLQDGFTIITHTPSYEGPSPSDDESSPRPGKRHAEEAGHHEETFNSTRSSGGGSRRPSFMQPTLASALKDQEVSEKLSSTTELKKDVAHTLNSGETGAERRPRSGSLGDSVKHPLTRRRSLSGTGKKDNSTARQRRPSRNSSENIQMALEAAELKRKQSLLSEEADEDVTGQYIHGDLSSNEGDEDKGTRARSSSGIDQPRSTVSSPEPLSVRSNESAREDLKLEAWWASVAQRTDAGELPNVSASPTIRLTGEGIESPHAIIRHEGGTVSLISLSDKGCLVNGSPVPPLTVVDLRSGHSVQFGSHPMLTVVIPFCEDAASPVNGMASPHALTAVHNELLQEIKKEHGDAIFQPRSTFASLSAGKGPTALFGASYDVSRPAKGRQTVTFSKQEGEAVWHPVGTDEEGRTTTDGFVLIPQGVKEALEEEVERLRGQLDKERKSHDRTRAEGEARQAKIQSDLHFQLDATKRTLQRVQERSEMVESQAVESAKLRVEQDQLKEQIERLQLSLEEAERNRDGLSRALRKLDAEKREERKELEEKLQSGEVLEKHRVMQSEVHTRHRQLDILKSQIGDKKLLAQQLQDAYDDRLSELEKEGEEHDITVRLHQLRQEEEKLSAKLLKHRRMKEDMMDAAELNSIDGYEFSGGVRLDAAMFRQKGIQLPLHSKTPVALRFGVSSMLVFNADALKSHAMASRRAPSPGPRGGPAPPQLQPIKEVVYDKIQRVVQVDGILQIISMGFSSNLGLLCENRTKRNTIHKLLMLKTKGVILPGHSITTEAGTESERLVGRQSPGRHRVTSPERLKELTSLPNDSSSPPLPPSSGKSRVPSPRVETIPS